MCDWTYAAYAVLAGASVNSAEQSRKTASEGRTQQREMIAKAEADKAKAEAEAVQSANARLAFTQQRRRQQNNLMASGAPTTAATNDSVISATPPSVGRRQGGAAVPLMQRGAPGAQFYGT